MPAHVYSVSDLTAYLKHLLEGDALLRGTEVLGEVSNLTYHRSGHVYFTLKDAQAQLSCVLFRGYAQHAPRMQVGDRVILKGGVSVYPPRGNYQFMVKGVRKQGMGDLYQRFVELKAKLEAEGLFAPARKRPLPGLPDRIAVITSPTGAAVRDILQALRRRYGRGQVLLLPTVVQGEQGVASILRSLEQAQHSAADVIILARGGGSLEDLWNFNQETVARAIAASTIPVVTGVGHETDFTIADFVADQRASTPTAAAETVTPDLAVLKRTVEEYDRQLHHSLQYYIDFKRQVLDDYSHRMEQAMNQYLRQKRHEVELLGAELKALDQTQLLNQGYTLTLKEGQPLRSADSLAPGDEIETIFHDGRRRSIVSENQS